ncbi:UDP-Glycosyltransferase/glycogen phosphorylase [Gigaspora margarita]|uniref:UDP-Glycosyltransferase/glycogen phosphorylase n=1 Tax=Gigaspora margarita TaxID=4874 RepID=A0A8H4AN66_GIGMA|nr:UDP-Glycosyltransferase/glycogen phosphorylase [Gigaspora margarita]
MRGTTSLIYSYEEGCKIKYKEWSWSGCVVILIFKTNVPKNILAASPLGGGSHLVPMLEILKILVDRGYNVTLAASGNFTANSESYRSIPQIITVFDPELYTKYYNIYKRITEEINVDLFFCDVGMNEACFDLAWQLEKPVVGFASNPIYASVPPSYKSDPVFGCHVNMENETFYERFKCSIIKPLQFMNVFMTIGNLLNDKRVNVGVEPIWDPRSRMKNILFLFDSFFGFEIPIPMLPLHQEIGPVLADTYPDLTPDLDSFLNAHPRTMYFALGTNVFTSPQNIVTLLKSCIELINQNIIDGVIWATVKTNITELMSFSNVDFPISDILNNNYPHIHIIKFAPQFAILSHENTKLFLSQGGASSSHESIYTATPMLVLPIMGDQFGNAEKLELAGIALRLSRLNLTFDDTVLKIKRLLSEESFKNNAKRLSFMAKLNSKRKYRAADLIEIVMNSAKYDSIEDENGNLKTNNNVLLKDWITADTRMGFIRGNYIDVYGTFIILALALIGGFGYALLKVAKYLYTYYKARNSNSKSKNE